MAVILIKLYIDLTLEFWPSFQDSQKVFFSDRMCFHFCTSFVHEFKSLIIADLEAADHAASAQEFSLVKLLVDFISDIIAA